MYSELSSILQCNYQFVINIIFLAHLYSISSNCCMVTCGRFPTVQGLTFRIPWVVSWLTVRLLELLHGGLYIEFLELLNKRMEHSSLWVWYRTSLCLHRAAVLLGIDLYNFWTVCDGILYHSVEEHLQVAVEMMTILKVAIMGLKPLKAWMKSYSCVNAVIFFLECCIIVKK
jgi:hypothetical protein